MCLIPFLANLVCKLVDTGISDASSQTAVKTLAHGITSTFSANDNYNLEQVSNVTFKKQIGDGVLQFEI